MLSQAPGGKASGGSSHPLVTAFHAAPTPVGMEVIVFAFFLKACTRIDRSSASNSLFEAFGTCDTRRGLKAVGMCLSFRTG